MKADTYHRITNGLMVAAVFSALLFDHAGSAKDFVGLVGILAGAGSIVTYLYNQRNNIESLAPVEPARTNEQIAIRNVSSVVATDRQFSSLGEHYFRPSIEPKRTVILSAYVQVYKQYQLSQKSVQRAEFVEDVVAIVSRLSTSREATSYEFLLTADRQLLIRPTNRLKRSREGDAHTFGETIPEVLASSLVQ